MKSNTIKNPLIAAARPNNLNKAIESKCFSSNINGSQIKLFITR